jgi:hypothetical protein
MEKHIRNRDKALRGANKRQGALVVFYQSMNNSIRGTPGVFSLAH